ncbi:MAG: hypothetical protein DMF65_01975, partial [Acidobacteria bacterium]
FYFLDADAARARWVSTDAALDDWTSQFIAAGARKSSLAEIFPWTKQSCWEADANAADIEAPVAQVLEDRTEGDVRTVRLRLSSPRRAPMLLFYADATAGLRRAVLDGKSLIDDAQGVENKTLRVSFAAPPPEGLELRLETRADAPLRIAVEDLSYGLPEIPGQNFRVRAEDTMPVPSYRTSDTTVVRKTLSIDPQKP